MAGTMAVLEGLRSEEFSPVKNAPGTLKDSPDSARAMLTAQSKNWLRAGGIKVVDGPGQLELGPFVSYRGEGLASLKKSLKGKPVNLTKDVLFDAKAPGQFK
jgi:UDP-N-acetylglucosamine/UDP-N-acetylgalactosamine diphosphorylase